MKVQRDRVRKALELARKIRGGRETPPIGIFDGQDVEGQIRDWNAHLDALGIYDPEVPRIVITGPEEPENDDSSALN